MGWVFWVRAPSPASERPLSFAVTEVFICLANYLLCLVSFTCEFVKRDAAKFFGYGTAIAIRKAWPIASSIIDSKLVADYSKCSTAAE